MKALRVLTFKREDKFAFVLCIASASAFLIYIIHVIIIRICHYPSFSLIGIVVTRHNIVYSTRPTSPLSLHCGTVDRVECLNTGKDRPHAAHT